MYQHLNQILYFITHPEYPAEIIKNCLNASEIIISSYFLENFLSFVNFLRLEFILYYPLK